MPRACLGCKLGLQPSCYPWWQGTRHSLLPSQVFKYSGGWVGPVGVCLDCLLNLEWELVICQHGLHYTRNYWLVWSPPGVIQQCNILFWIYVICIAFILISNTTNTLWILKHSSSIRTCNIIALVNSHGILMALSNTWHSQDGMKISAFYSKYNDVSENRSVKYILTDFLIATQIGPLAPTPQHIICVAWITQNVLT